MLNPNRTGAVFTDNDDEDAAIWERLRSMAGARQPPSSERIQDETTVRYQSGFRAVARPPVTASATSAHASASVDGLDDDDSDPWAVYAEYTQHKEQARHATQVATQHDAQEADERELEQEADERELGHEADEREFEQEADGEPHSTASALDDENLDDEEGPTWPGEDELDEDELMQALYEAEQLKQLLEEHAARPPQAVVEAPRQAPRAVPRPPAHDTLTRPIQRAVEVAAPQTWQSADAVQLPARAPRKSSITGPRVAQRRVPPAAPSSDEAPWPSPAAPQDDRVTRRSAPTPQPAHAPYARPSAPVSQPSYDAYAPPSAPVSQPSYDAYAPPIAPVSQSSYDAYAPPIAPESQPSYDAFGSSAPSSLPPYDAFAPSAPSSLPPYDAFAPSAPPPQPLYDAFAAHGQQEFASYDDAGHEYGSASLGASASTRAAAVLAKLRAGWNGRATAALVGALLLGGGLYQVASLSSRNDELALALADVRVQQQKLSEEQKAALETATRSEAHSRAELESRLLRAEQAAAAAALPVPASSGKGSASSSWLGQSKPERSSTTSHRAEAKAPREHSAKRAEAELSKSSKSAPRLEKQKPVKAESAKPVKTKKDSDSLLGGDSSDPLFGL